MTSPTNPPPVPESSAGPESSAVHDDAAAAEVHRRRQELEQKLKLCPTDRDSFLELASLYRNDGLPLHATRVLKQAHELFPDDQTVLWEWEEAQLARSLQQLGVMRQMAEETRSAALLQDVERSEVDWANCRFRICSARLQRTPDQPFLRLVLGEALYDLERYDDAIAELEPLADSDKHSPAAFLLMGRCHLVSSRDADAMRCLRQASMRRGVVGSPKIRIAALKLLIDLADRHGLTATTPIYQQLLQSLQTDSQPETKATA